MESDYAFAITAINNSSSNISIFGLLAENVRSFAELVSLIQFQQAPRLCNGVAYKLAKFAISLGSEVVWLEEPLVFIQDLLSHDIM